MVSSRDKNDPGIAGGGGGGRERNCRGRSFFAGFFFAEFKVFEFLKALRPRFGYGAKAEGRGLRANERNRNGAAGWEEGVQAREE